MKFNVTLDKEQLDEIASITADKVLSTVKYQKSNEEWYEREIKELKLEVSKRDSMLVKKDLIIERLSETLRRVRAELKELKES
jgi:D-mannonate dehydratase